MQDALLAPYIKKLETYFALIYFWTFSHCEQTLIPHKFLAEATKFIQLWLSGQIQDTLAGVKRGYFNNTRLEMKVCYPLWPI